MKSSTLVVLGLILVGGLLIYAGIRDVSPVDVVKAALTGQPLPKKK